jgi:hypothetical protein
MSFANVLPGGFAITLAVAVVAGPRIAAASERQQEIARNIEAIRSGPALFFTADAVDLPLSPKIKQAYNVSSDQKAGRQMLDACFALSDAGNAAREAVAVLAERYPRAVHAELSDNLRYTRGAGTFEDWVMTKKMGAKTRFELHAPFASYDQLEPCLDYIEVYEDHELLDPRYSGGQLQSARVSMQITYVFYAGACALSRITGADLGTDRHAWKNRFGAANTQIPTDAVPAAAEPLAKQALGYDSLLAHPGYTGPVDISLANGAVLIGDLVSIDQRRVRIRIPGVSPVTVQRHVIERIGTGGSARSSPW